VSRGIACDKKSENSIMLPQVQQQKGEEGKKQAIAIHFGPVAKLITKNSAQIQLEYRVELNIFPLKRKNS